MPTPDAGGDMSEPIRLTTGDPSTPAEAAERIVLILGCTNESGGVFKDDLETITTIISDLLRACGSCCPHRPLKEHTDAR